MDAPITRPAEAEIAALHASLPTLDTHVDIPWPDMPDPVSYTHLTLPTILLL